MAKVAEMPEGRIDVAGTTHVSRSLGLIGKALIPGSGVPGSADVGYYCLAALCLLCNALGFWGGGD